jgi:hypothetical protein
MPVSFAPDRPGTFPSKKTDYYAALKAYYAAQSKNQSQEKKTDYYAELKAYYAEQSKNQSQENNTEAVKDAQRALQAERCNNRVKK